MEVAPRYKLHTLLNTVQTIYFVFIDFNNNTVHCVFTALLFTAYISYTAYIVFINVVAYTAFTAHTACTASTAVRSCVEQQGDICGAFFFIPNYFLSIFSISSHPGWQAGTINVTLLGNTGL